MTATERERVRDIESAFVAGGLCACGDLDPAARALRGLLERAARSSPPPHVEAQDLEALVPYLLDTVGITTHGVSIGPDRMILTEKGEAVLDLLRRFELEGGS